MDEKEKKLREDLEFHLDTLSTFPSVVSASRAATATRP